MLERLAAMPKPFQVVGIWRHADGSTERRDYRPPQPRRPMAENCANGLRRFIGKPDRTPQGTAVTLESVEVEERTL
jgi:hypothetical protein